MQLCLLRVCVSTVFKPIFSFCVLFEKDDPIGNLNTAFEVAEKFLDIPKMLDAEGKDAGLRRSQHLKHDRRTLD